MKLNPGTKPESLDDLIFEDRNKIYGAYFLRTTYEATLRKSLAISATLILAALIISGFGFRHVKKASIPVFDTDTTVYDPQNYIPISENPEQPAPAATSVAHNDVPVPVPDNLQSDVAGEEPGITNNTSLEPGTGSTEPTTGGNATIPNSGTAPANAGTSETSETFGYVPDMPEFPGGSAALERYIIRNFNVPNYIEDEQVSIRVFFVVNEDGKITNVSASTDNSALKREAERVVNNMPPWKPGKMNGRPVKVQYRLPIKIKGAF
jgi:protein TonB